MAKLQRILRSERGDLLTESLVAVVILGAVLAPTAGVISAAAKTADSTSQHNARSIAVESVLSDELPYIASYSTTPQTIMKTVNGQAFPVTVWRQDSPGGVALLRAAAPESGDAAGDCADPTTATTAGCIVSAITPPALGGIPLKMLTLEAGTGGALHEATIRTGLTEIRYTFKAAAPATASTVVFATKEHPDNAWTVNIPANQSGYYSGRLLVDAGTRLTLTTTGATISSVLLYEAP